MKKNVIIVHKNINKNKIKKCKIIKKKLNFG